MKTRKFIDHVTLYATAGNGGNGSASFRREKFVPKGGPDGGDGGRGGHVILSSDPDVDSLINLYFSPHQRAGHGGHGGGSGRTGRNGKDCLIKVPCGTEIRDRETGVLLDDLIEPGQERVVAYGGKGGLGNIHFKSSTHQSPQEQTNGDPGDDRALLLDLKIMADIGLVGFPNAGKSSLLRCLSDAHPKVAPYPFTTLNPVLGTVIFEDYTRLKIADIPGLIKGAHEGTGLGDEFLRHIERARFLMVVIDMAAVDTRDPVEDYQCLMEELACYDETLLARPRCVVANKMDLPDAQEHYDVFQKETGLAPIPVSAEQGEGMEQIKQTLADHFRQAPSV